MAFGAIWLIDGILQFQASMPLGMANGIVAPAAAGTPSWLHALMFDGIGIWNNHPIALAVGTAWLQVGIGLLLIVSNATIGRIAAAVSVGWAGLIWLVGNGAGGIFQSTNSILFGWPGASLFYLVAGVWLALPSKNFPARFSRYTLRGLSVLALIGALLQSLPSRGFWHGGNTNALTTMSTNMTATSQRTRWPGSSNILVTSRERSVAASTSSSSSGSVSAPSGCGWPVIVIGDGRLAPSSSAAWFSG